MPFQLAASNKVTPYGTRTARSLKIRLIRTGPGATSSATVTVHPWMFAPSGMLCGPPTPRVARTGRKDPCSLAGTGWHSRDCLALRFCRCLFPGLPGAMRGDPGRAPLVAAQHQVGRLDRADDLRRARVHDGAGQPMAGG